MNQKLVGAKQKKIENLMNVINGFQNEKEAIAFFIQKRWHGIVTCPHAACFHYQDTKNKIYALKDGKTFRCSSCLRQFSYKTGSIFDDSKIPMKKWFTAIYLHTANKKGISSIQLGKHIGVTQKTAWFMLHRLRYALKNKDISDSSLFTGTTEVDEIYLGGKEANKHTNKKGKSKTIAIGIVNRETGVARVEKIDTATYGDLAEKVMENVEHGSNLVTDGLSAYTTLGIYYNHKSVNHSAKEYVRTEAHTAFKIHTNTVEGMFGHLRRTIVGTYHWFSEKHMNKYLEEISFRYSTRHELDSERFFDFLTRTEGKLSYKKLIRS